MRQLLIIASVVGCFMYAGFAVEHGSTATFSSQISQESDLAALQTALNATGAGLHQVQITGWAQFQDPLARDAVAEDLDWPGGKVPPGEVREIKVHHRDGMQYLSVRWVLSGGAKLRWQEAPERVRRALLKHGRSPVITVQLEGVASRTDITEMASEALDAVDAQDRQPWTATRSTSLAGRTALLPASSFGVNIQVATRRDTVSNKTRVWVAWPGLQQEY